MGVGECTGWPFGDLDPRSRLLHPLAQICLSARKVRTTHPITTKNGSFIALVMVITWWDFGEVLLKTVILANSPVNFRMCFFRLMGNEKEVHQLGTRYNVWLWPLTQGLKLTLIPWSDFLLLLSKSRSKSDHHRSYFLSLKADIWLDWVAKLCS